MCEQPRRGGLNSKALLLTEGLCRPLPIQAMRGAPAAAQGYLENLNSKHSCVFTRKCSLRGFTVCTVPGMSWL